MTSNDQFKQFVRFRACQDAREWVENRSLVQAWRDCQRGSWMAFWLGFGAHNRRDELARLANTIGLDDWDMGIMASGLPPQLDAEWADLLRKHYTPSGRRRTVRK